MKFNNNYSQSLKASFWDGVFASIMLGFTTNYITPFALVLGAKNLQIGLLTSLPQLFSAIVQLKATEVAEHLKSRVNTITIFVFLQAITLILTFTVLIIPSNLNIPLFIFLITLGNIFAAIATPAWASLMSDTVNKNEYGKYFAWRGKVLGLINLIFNFIAGFWLYSYPNKLNAFVILFVSAGFARILSAVYLKKMHDIPLHIDENKKFNYIKFIKRLSESNFAKFVLFVSLINFATFIASPFFPVYMLKEINLDYSTYTLITTSSSVSGLLLLTFWGKLCDKYGNAKVIKITSKLLWTLPILWLFSKNILYLILINIFGGYIWAGFNLAIVNFIFDVASPEVRTRCFAYFTFTNGFLIFLGATIGGFLTNNLTLSINNSNLLTIFLISGILRLIICIALIDSFKEVREVRNLNDKDMFLTILGLKKDK